MSSSKGEALAASAKWWRTTLRTAFAAVALLAAWAPPETAFAKPARIVSINLCADQLLLLLAERRRIASVSFLAADPNDSPMVESVAGLELNHGLAEEILPLKPDLVLAGAHTAQPTVFLLRKLGYAVVELPETTNLDDVRRNIRMVAGAIGEAQRGEELVAAFDRKLAALPPAPAGRRPLAVLYWPAGYTSGRGTLATAALEAAGFRNLGSELGISGTSQVSLETLLGSNAEVLVIGRQRDEPALANVRFRHPALRRAFAGRRQVNVPDRLWACGTPFVADAVALLSAVRAGQPRERPAAGEDG